jgi:UPF0716 family protein affecting phage T7 exclusion
MAEISPEDCQKKAAEVGFDLTKQFLTLAFAGIAFVVGLSFNTPGTISDLMFWIVIIPFAASVVIGLLYLMRGVNQLSEQNSYDIYAPSLRALAGLQIALTVVGVVLLVPVLRMHPVSKNAPNVNSMELKINGQQSVVYPLDPNKNVSIELDGQKLTINATKK